MGCYLRVRFFNVPRPGALIAAVYFVFDIHVQLYNWTSQHRERDTAWSLGRYL
jgi:hypothetical protein